MAADLATVSGRSERPGGGRVYIQIRTKVREVRTGKRAYKNLDTCRYEPGYVQIRSICPDTDKLEYTYWSTYINTYEYVGKNTYINTYEYLHWQYVFVRICLQYVQSTSCKTADGQVIVVSVFDKWLDFDLKFVLLVHVL